MAKKIVYQLREFGRTKRGWLGVQIQSVTNEIAESLDLDNSKGAFVASVQEDSPAEIAGIEAGDIILEFNNILIDTYRDLPRLVAETDVESTISIVIWRKNKSINVSVKIGELDEPIYASKNDKNSDDQSLGIESIGISVRELLSEEYASEELKNIKGVVVVETISEEIPLMIGDIIIEINREKITNSEQFLNLVLEIKEKGRSSILLRVIRDKKAIWITLKYLKQ